MAIQLVPEIVEANGKTVRENNMAIEHTIPIGTLVEVNAEYLETHRIRLYVVEHSRDCDGEPLYNIGPFKNVAAYNRNSYNKFKIDGPYSADSLIVIGD